MKNKMEIGIVRESSSFYAFPLVIAKKKDGSNRICAYYRKLNLVLVTDSAPIMTTDEDLFQRWESANIIPQYSRSD